MDGSKLRPHVPLADKLMMPSPGMPVFGKDRLTGQEVQAIEKYLWPDAARSRAGQAPPEQEKTVKGKDKKAWLKGFGTAD